MCLIETVQNLSIVAAITLREICRFIRGTHIADVGRNIPKRCTWKLTIMLLCLLRPLRHHTTLNSKESETFFSGRATTYSTSGVSVRLQPMATWIEFVNSRLRR